MEVVEYRSLTISVSEIASELASSPSVSDTSLYMFKSLRQKRVKFSFADVTVIQHAFERVLWRIAISGANGLIFGLGLGRSQGVAIMWGVFLITTPSPRRQGRQR